MSPMMARAITLMSECAYDRPVWIRTRPAVQEQRDIVEIDHNGARESPGCDAMSQGAMHSVEAKESPC